MSTVSSSRRAFPRCGIYLIADAATCPGATLVRAVEAALSQGVRLVQYRDKAPLSCASLDIARALAAQAHAHGAVFLVNDRADVARMCGADGVHVGQEDLPVAAVRRVMGEEAWVGVSTHSPEEARRAEVDGADYIGFGNVFGTTSKADATPPQGVEALAGICRSVSIPVYAIGGVGLDNLTRVKAAGAAGGAVISAVLGAPDAGEAAARLLALWGE